ncbi:MAG TPA: hypothetical protein VJ728_05270 [Candidatus Binataceae bacterium]|nr:hypothetical protein [Candidatus Binataceae bacterium]
MPELLTEISTARRAGSTGEIPFFFAAGRPLYGAFHPTDGSHSQNPVVVFCHAVGTEHMLTQRIEVLGARAVATVGFPAFRYNARAHGDSAGNPRDLTFEDLVTDACAAADMARELSGASRVIWVGLRFGCLIAAEAIRRRGDASALALWEPLHTGMDYFRSLVRATLFTQIAKGKRPGATADDMLKQLERDGELAVVGAFVYRAFYQSARDADLARSLQDWRGDTLIAQVQSRRQFSANNERLRSTLEQREGGGKVAAVLVTQEPAWSMLPIARPQWTSDALLTATKEWLHGLE